MLQSRPGDARRRALDGDENAPQPAGPCLALLNMEALTSRAREMGAPQVEFTTDAAPRMQTEPIRIISCGEGLETVRQPARNRIQPPIMRRNTVVNIPVSVAGSAARFSHLSKNKKHMSKPTRTRTTLKIFCRRVMNQSPWGCGSTRIVCTRILPIKPRVLWRTEADL